MGMLMYHIAKDHERIIKHDDAHVAKVKTKVYLHLILQWRKWVILRCISSLNISTTSPKWIHFGVVQIFKLRSVGGASKGHSFASLIATEHNMALVPICDPSP